MKNSIGSFLNSKKYLAAAIASTIIFSALFIVALFADAKNSALDGEYQANATELRVLAHKISARSWDAVEGKEYAFAELADGHQSFDKKFNELVSGTPDVKALPSVLDGEVGVLGDKWRYISSDVEKIMAHQGDILLLNAVSERFDGALANINREHELVSGILAKKRTGMQEVLLVQKQNLAAHQLSTLMNRLLAGDIGHTIFIKQFSQNIEQINKGLSALLNGSKSAEISKLVNRDAISATKQIVSELEVINTSLDKLTKAAPNIIEARAASNRIKENTPLMLTATNVLRDAIGELPSKRLLGAEMALLCAAGIAISLLSIGWILYRQTVSRLSIEKTENDNNQKAIQRLLSEINELADGDLTTEATVSEEFTGAIADSINFTVEQLRGIVSSINDTTERITGAAQTTQSKTMSLADSSNAQVREILEASTSVNDMAGTMRRMSEEAARSSTVAKSSVEIAKSGARVVKNTIVGMDSIREQIQDTSKRIKRLGESSQEIGDIVSLITDIADQTNILALNASIQASMAGDAGRGFAVVADEVQRLAERSSSATRQIEALVRTIQSDTNEAVISMEQTTSEVVSGASLTNDAGVALEEIERVSMNISELITEISDSANTHADKAADISKAMGEIKETTSETAKETMAAAKNMGQLSGMTVDLKESVAGFKMPEHIKGSSTKYADVPTVTNRRAM